MVLDASGALAGVVKGVVGESTLSGLGVERVLEEQWSRTRRPLWPCQIKIPSAPALRAQPTRALAKGASLSDVENRPSRQAQKQTRHSKNFRSPERSARLRRERSSEARADARAKRLRSEVQGRAREPGKCTIGNQEFRARRAASVEPGQTR